MCRVSGRTLRTPYFVNSGEVASDEMLLISIVSDDLASDDMSSGALPQTRFFRRTSSDAFFQTHFFRCSKLQYTSFCSLTCSIKIFVNSTLIIDPVHLSKCLAYPIDNF